MSIEPFRIAMPDADLADLRSRSQRARLLTGIEEQAWQKRIAAWLEQEGAYAKMHGTKPYTAAIGLNDSPAGLAAWIGEKFHAWPQDFDATIGVDTLRTNLSLYWFTQTISASMRVYVEGRAKPFALQERVRPPLGMAAFPGRDPAAAAQLGRARL